ncbi:MAG: HAMP domain-containing histidine kinase [Campylobacteraceae bacterium]|nr:HAMP domain-containing histidine kinase [Campylobacteraceae bacterium]
MLIQQSKLAMMGEMIANIAHQWRQPLMQLSASIIYLDAYNEKGKLTKERFDKKIKDSTLVIDFMSKTIEDFRDYFKPEKQKEDFLIKEAIDSALFIIDSTLKSSNINVFTEYENKDIKILAFKNEFSQALLNIISNAKDILILREIVKPQIHITIYTKDNKHFISIKDNAKGIDKNIIDKIFDPYFTTKHKSQGTGIGLYMSKMIIENNIKGKINVITSEYGAEFIISLG